MSGKASLQKRNAGMVDILSGDLQKRYEPNFAAANAISVFSMLPGLRSFWPMSTHLVVGNDIFIADVVCNYHLTMVANPLIWNRGLAPYVSFGGVNQYLRHADDAQFDIIGNEAYIGSPGLTVGGWFQFDRDTNGEGLICKSDGTNANRNWDLLFRGDVAGDPAQFSVSNGVTGYTATGTDDLATGVWYFIVGKYVPSTSVNLFVNMTKSTFTTAIPATLNNSNADLQIGARNAALPLDGRCSLCFVCASAVPDVMIYHLFHQTRALFGVR